MSESRIELTERLRREHRWDAACIFRDKVRQQGRDDGLTKREANTLAWEKMASTFKPLSKEEMAAYPSTLWAIMGKFSLESPKLDNGEEPDFADVHLAMYLSIALIHGWKNRSALGVYRAVSVAIDHLIEINASDKQRHLVSRAIVDPTGFLLGPARSKLQAVELRLKPAGEAGEVLEEYVAGLIRSMLRSIDRMETENPLDVVQTDFAIG